tara:strand:+ start:109 stop:405 length:297 start_codon:yes stop_codon:yes gene_type:complete
MIKTMRAKRKKDKDLWAGKWLNVSEIKKDSITEKFYLIAYNMNSRNNYGDDGRTFELDRFEEFKLSPSHLEQIFNRLERFQLSSSDIENILRERQPEE